MLQVWPFELKRIAGQRRPLLILFTGISRKAGESVSGFRAYYDAAQLTAESFDALDQVAFKLENGLLRLVEALERKRDTDTWIDTLGVQEFNSIYLANEPDSK